MIHCVTRKEAFRTNGRRSLTNTDLVGCEKMAVSTTELGESGSLSRSQRALRFVDFRREVTENRVDTEVLDAVTDGVRMD